MLAKGKKIAAAALEAGEGDIEYKNGAFNVVGTDRRMSLFDVAARAKEMKKKGEIAEDLDTKVVTETPLTFPNGCHIAEVEVDPQTGAVDARLLFGAGRQRQHPRPHHRRGPGARLGRHGRRPGDAGADRVRRRRPAGQRLVHGLRHAARAPPAAMFKDDRHEVPATTNPLGVKGAGEAGTTAAIAAVMNAFADAIPGAGHKIQMPATPEKVWKACREMAG